MFFQNQARMNVMMVGIVFVFLVGEVPTHLASRLSALTLLYGGDPTKVSEYYMETWVLPLNNIKCELCDYYYDEISFISVYLSQILEKKLKKLQVSLFHRFFVYKKFTFVSNISFFLKFIICWKLISWIFSLIGYSYY